MDPVEQIAACVPQSTDAPSAASVARGGPAARALKAGAKDGAAKAKAGGGASKQKGGRGRPARDAGRLLRGALRDLSTAEASSKFFTSEWKNVNRNWSNYMIDIGQMIEHEDDPAALEELVIIEKTCKAVRTVLQKLSTRGMSSEQAL